MNNIKAKVAENTNQRTVLYQLMIIVLVGFNFLVSCANGSKINGINKQQIIGVQLANGEVVTARTASTSERSTETIHNFIQSWLYLSFNWTTDDLTIELPDSKTKVPGNVYASTFAITPNKDFRSQYTEEFANLIAKATEKHASVQSAIDITHISRKPSKIREGVWEVTVISTWTGLDASKGKAVFEIPINKKFLVKSIPIGGKQSFVIPEDLTQLQLIADNINQYGLQIVSLENYDL